MDWLQESGFKKTWSCIDYVFKKLSPSNQKINTIAPDKFIDLCIVDACSPTEYQNQKTKVLLTNNYIEPGLLNPIVYEQFSKSWYGMYAGVVDITDCNPIRSFNCFINRMDPIRQSWLYQLLRRDIFDQGYVSFNMDISRHISLEQCQPNASPLEVFDQQFEEHLKIFQPEHNYIRNHVPYRNFDTENLNQIIMQSKFSIVLETYFVHNETITYSEKIFRCLKLPRPWVLFSMRGAVQYLQELGFDVLDDLVDHSYDRIDNAMERQVKLLDISQDLCKIEFTPGMVDRMNAAATHNQQLLFKLFDTYFEDIDFTFEKAIAKCLKL